MLGTSAILEFSGYVKLYLSLSLKIEQDICKGSFRNVWPLTTLWACFHYVRESTVGEVGSSLLVPFQYPPLSRNYRRL